MPEAGAFKKGRFVPSIQAFRPWPLMNLRVRGARNRASPSAKASRGRDPSGTSSPRSEVFRGRSAQGLAPGNCAGGGGEAGEGDRAASGVTVNMLNQNLFTPSWCRGEPLGLESNLG